MQPVDPTPTPAPSPPSHTPLKQAASYHRAPPDLAAAVRARLREARPAPHASTTTSTAWLGSPAADHADPAVSPGWYGLASGWRWLFPLSSAFAMGAAAAVLMVNLLAGPAPDNPLLDEVVAGHVRSLQVAHLSDVVSTDQHTVKPWFAGKLDYAPPVVDLAAAGFPLVGGRLDYLGGRPVAALAYRHAQHVVNLFVWPAAKAAGAEARAGADGASAPQLATRQGFNTAAWQQAGMQFWAVSDLQVDELKAFALGLAAKNGH